jgi:hypothetical protein
MPMRYPDEDLTEVQWSLERFNTEAYELLHDRNDVDAFTRLVLAGRVNIDNDLKRIYLNPRQGLPNIENVKIYRDFDSAIGITRTLPFSDVLRVWPVAPFKETLSKDNHVKGLAFDSNVREHVHRDKF